MATPKIVLWRHGQTDWNIENRFQGHTDLALNAVGKFQVEHAAKVLIGLNPVKIVASDLTRTRETAAALSALTSLEVVLDAGLRETNGGNWEGRTGEENRAEDEENFIGWLHGDDRPAGGIGERRSEVAARTLAVIMREIADVDGTVIFVTHGGSARCILGSILDLPLDKWAKLGGLSNASWSVLEQNSFGAWFLTEHNAGSLPEPLFGNESGS